MQWKCFPCMVDLHSKCAKLNVNPRHPILLVPVLLWWVPHSSCCLEEFFNFYFILYGQYLIFFSLKIQREISFKWLSIQVIFLWPIFLLTVESKHRSEVKMRIACQDPQQHAKAWQWVNVSQKERFTWTYMVFLFHCMWWKGATWWGIFERDMNSAPSVKAFSRRWEILLAKRRQT